MTRTIFVVKRQENTKIQLAVYILELFGQDLGLIMHCRLASKINSSLFTPRTI